MKNFFYLGLSLAIASFVALGCDNLPDSGLEGYELVWNDEFNHSGFVDSDKWAFEEWEPAYVNNELQRYVKSGKNKSTRTAWVRKGVLNIRALKVNDEVISARLNSCASWKYGYFEARIQLPKGKGTWPAFWMLPVDLSDGWPMCGEIDIMEEVGADPDTTSATIHTGSYNHMINTQKTKAVYTEGAEDGFHLYSCEWTPERISFFTDRVLTHEFINDGTGDVNTWPFDKNFHIILNLAWGGDWGGYKGVDESALPCVMKVDYVRVYQKIQH